MLLAATFAINSALNFVLGLLIAKFLGPEQFGLYALGAALLVLVNAFGIDWLKLATIRFYSNSKRAAEPAIRATLDGLAALCTLAMITPLLAAVAAGVDMRIPTAIAAAAVAAGIVGGLFDYQQAIARAREEDAAYVRMVLVKNICAFTLMVGGAWWTQDPALVLVGSALSSLAALVTARRALADAPLDLKAMDGARVRAFAAYALPLVATNVLLSTIPLLNRAVMASFHGLAEAGYFALASDIAVKLMGTLGATLEILLLPLAVKALDRDGPAAAHAQIGRNLVVVLAVILPAGLGILVALPAIEALAVPKAYHGHLGPHLWLLMPGLMALPIMQAGFNPVYLMARRTLVSTMAALVAVAVNGALLGLALSGWLGISSAHGISLAMSAGFVAGAVIVAAGAARRARVLPGLRDVALIGLGLALVVALGWPLRRMEPAFAALSLQILACGAAYGAVMIAGNVACCRDVLGAYLRHRLGRAAA